MNRKRNRKAFTIVELVIVIAVIAILATTLVPTFGNVISNAQEAAAKQEAKNAFTSYMIQHPEHAGSLFVYEAGGRYVAIKNGAPVGVYDNQSAALVALELDPRAVLTNTGDGKLFAYGGQVPTPSEPPIQPDEPVDSKVVDLVIFMGQSNMSGRGVASQAPVVPEGHGYEFRAFSDPTKLYTVAEPFGVTENNPNGVTENTPKTGSMVSALMNAYYEDRGVPIVGVSCSRGGTNIAYWAPDGVALNDAITRHNTAKKWLEDNGYTIGRDFMVWCQGEADRKNGTEYYTNSLEAIIDEMMAEAGIEFCAVARIGNLLNFPGECDKLIKAQTEFCKTSDKAILASAKAAGFGWDKMKADGTHYTQAGYNEVGTEAGHNIAYYVASGKEPTMHDPKFNNTYPVDDLPDDPIDEPPVVNYTDYLEFDFNAAVENGIDLSIIGTVSNGALTVTADTNNENGIPLKDPIKITASESFTFEFILDYSAPGSEYPGILFSEGSTSGGFIFLNQSNLRLRDSKKVDFDGKVSSASGAVHFAIVYDVESNTITVYQNYEKVTVTNADKIIHFGPLTLTHLCGGYNEIYKFRGTFYYAKYVNQALTAEDFHREIIEEDNEKKLEFFFDEDWENGINIGSLGVVSNGELTVTTASNPDGIKLIEPITLSKDESFTIEFVSTKALDGLGSIILSEGPSKGYLYLSTKDLRLRNSVALGKKQISGTLENENEVNHYAVVYDATSKTIKMYLNHEELSVSDSVKLADLGTLTFGYLLGGYDSTYEYKGTISYFRYVNKALTAEEFHKEG